MNVAVLLRHFASYPRMQALDAVKLCYQSAFGGEHLLDQKERMLLFLRQEMEKIQLEKTEASFEPIGGGYARLNLKSSAVQKRSAEDILRMMELSIVPFSKNMETFQTACQMVSTLAEQGKAPFSLKEFEEEEGRFRLNGCKPVHHSQIYHDNYCPAYRVLLQDYALLLPVINIINESKPAIVLFDGPCGSGKTTIAKRLSDYYETISIPMDDFFLPPEMRTRERLSIPGNNLHWERFIKEVIPPVRQRKSFVYHRFDCFTGQYIPVKHDYTALTIFEGSYSNHPEVIKACADIPVLRVFVSVPEREQLSRLQLRNASMLPAFEMKWIPLEKKYFEAYDVEGQADIVVKSLPWEES